MPPPPPGWYADPAGGGLYRWWDGTHWTDELNADARAPAPPRPAAHRPVPGERAGSDDNVVAASGAPPDRAENGARAVVPRSARPKVGPLVLIVTTALVVAAVWGAGPALVRSHKPVTASGLATTPAPSPGASNQSRPTPGPQRAVRGGSLDQRTGEVRIGTATMTLPSPPYRMSTDVVELGSSVDAGFSASAVVHAGHGTVPGWYSTVALLHVPASAVRADPEQSGQQAMAAVTAWLYGSSLRTVSGRWFRSVLVDDEPAVRLGGQAWYRIPGLASTHDDLTLVVVQLTDGSYVAALSSVPDDAPPAHRRLAATSLATLHVS